MTNAIKVICYAEGQEGHWEAFCLNFDLAVEGSSLPEVKRKLSEQIELYLETVHSLPEAEQRALINRKAPLWMWFKVALSVIRSRFGSNGKDFNTFSCHASA